jgi:amino acid transporter
VAQPSFRRALGLLTLTALGLNSVIGTGIFLTPGSLAATLNGWSILAFGLGGLLCYAIALCFAEMAARVPETGGAYAYARTTFGPLPGFLVGWVIWLSSVLGWAAVAAALAGQLHDRFGGSIQVLLLLVVVGLSVLNGLGARAGAMSNAVLAAVKFIPLAVFVGWTVGRLRPISFHATSDWATGALYILYTFSGFEEIPVPAGEVEDPQRTIPRALAWVLSLATVVYMVIQAVVCGMGQAGSAAPLTDAAAGVPWLAAVVAGASLISMASVNASIAFTGPRSLWALAHERWRWVGLLHPRLATPVRAIGVTATLTLALAWNNTVDKLMALSALASLLQYLPTVVAVMVWRRRTATARPAFLIPGGYAVPILALGVCLVLLANCSGSDILGAAEALLVGLVLYPLLGRPLSHRPTD